MSEQIYWFDPAPVSGRKNVLLMTNCTGRGIRQYLLGNQEFRDRFNLTFIETGPLSLAESRGDNVMESETMLRLLGWADVYIGHNLGPRHKEKALWYLMDSMKEDAKIITFTAPNFSAFWPIAHGFGGDVAVHVALDAGKSRDEIWKSLKDGTFDCLFNIRWRFEMGRLASMDGYHNIGISTFIKENFRKAKLFNAISHPSSAMIAYICCRIMDQLGCKHQSLDEVLSLDPMTYGISGQPETPFEFKHFKFEYQMRYTDGFDSYYGTILDQCVQWHKVDGWVHKMDA